MLRHASCTLLLYTILSAQTGSVFWPTL